MFDKVLSGIALIVVTMFTSFSCVENPALPDSFGDGVWDAGRTIQAGTYRTENPGPHTATIKCEWTVFLRSNEGTVLLRNDGDVAETPQVVYVPAGRKIRSANCGLWEKISDQNETD